MTVALIILNILGFNNPPEDHDNSVSPRYTDWGYSLRRYFIDDFYTRQLWQLGRGLEILDLGGKKIGKRSFDISQYDMNVTYANIESTTQPDIVCDAANLSICSAKFDVVICSEVLMYLADPRQSIVEIHRVLKPGGRLLLCNPFLYPEATSEQDHDRYHLTKTFFVDFLAHAGFSNIVIEPQGQFHSVLANMLKMYANAAANGTVQTGFIKRKMISLLALWLQRRAFRLEMREEITNHSFYSRFATGYGVIAIKRSKGEVC